jgi:hypothetical protein
LDAVRNDLIKPSHVESDVFPEVQPTVGRDGLAEGEKVQQAAGLMLQAIEQAGAAEAERSQPSLQAFEISKGFDNHRNVNIVGHPSWPHIEKDFWN